MFTRNNSNQAVSTDGSRALTRATKRRQACGGQSSVKGVRMWVWAWTALCPHMGYTSTHYILGAGQSPKKRRVQCGLGRVGRAGKCVGHGEGTTGTTPGQHTHTHTGLCGCVQGGTGCVGFGLVDVPTG